ncbi:ABC transporter ATP-binding protein [Paracoccus acridae]|uniref:ABC transporter ATP-binding protein n=1 Tax=Paracoccus acridae TaxID=1795310 RepID=A0ABQ1VMZ5_9RHOB|nr:ABC transporter ATP-binding protein [Paracoccus acridae]GGF79849.1 ABC transporter ATP-binding protein [Paracoccus acridae]
MSGPLLDIRGLTIGIPNRNGPPLQIVRDLSFDIMPGEIFGLVGESGSGKSASALALMGLNRRPLTTLEGQALYGGQDLLAMSRRSMRKLRGDRISMIFQEPMTALNPLARIGSQIAEMFVLHRGLSWSDARPKAVEALAAVQVPDPKGRARAYPHQLSGGLRQRVMIAMAMACRPDLLIADEPTTALDVTVQAEVLRLIRELCEREGTAVLLISHDLGVIAQMCQRVGVMANGRLRELRDAKALFTDPRHPYTQGLLAALPRLGSRATEGRHRLADLDMAIDRDAPGFSETYLRPRGEAA